MKVHYLKTYPQEGELAVLWISKNCNSDGAICCTKQNFFLVPHFYIPKNALRESNIVQSGFPTIEK